MMGRSRRTARRTSRRTSRRMARRMNAAQAASAPTPQETAPPPAAPAPQAEAPQTKPYVKELEELAALKDQGIITEEEFQAKKKQILNL